VALPQDQTPRTSRGASLEATFTEGQHISATAGVSFLYHTLGRGEVAEGESALPPAPLTCHGDIGYAQVLPDLPNPTSDEADTLVELYFRFAVPTYRFLHRPTLEMWASSVVAGRRLSAPETACVFLAMSQALLFTRRGDRYGAGGDQDFVRSQQYFQKAKILLAQEPGPPSLASVQARLAMCLYLLSTFRFNECRYCFSLACTILTSIGLHRRTPATAKLDPLNVESRKRTFWCAYVLDGYLSVMLGRPRILRDEDIDQPYPRNIDDQDLLSAESFEDLPLHGCLEAFIAHGELAKLMGRNSDLLYPLRSLTDDELFDRTSEMLQAITAWTDSLPDFLKPRNKTLAGQRTFERQNTVLKLGHSHLRILITRRCLLADFSRLGRRNPTVLDERARNPLQVCADAIATILNATDDLFQRDALYQSFWFTQYVALVAISTLYVFSIQSTRANIPEDVFPDIKTVLEKAKICQRRLTELAPEGSQTRRHFRLLDRLRQRAERNASRGQEAGTSDPYTFANTMSTEQRVASGGPASHFGVTLSDPQRSDMSDVVPGTFCTDIRAGVLDPFTPADDEYIFPDLLGWGWEGLDTVGFPGDSVGM
jgi:hypothetical protein